MTMLMCHAQAMAPKVTRHARVGGPSVTYNEGVREVGDLEIRWRIPMAVRMTPDWSEGADWDAKVPVGGPVMELVDFAIVKADENTDAVMAIPTNFETTIIDHGHGRRYQLLIDAESGHRRIHNDDRRGGPLRRGQRPS